MEQMTIWEEIYDTYKITKPIRMIELFAGIGSQFKAIKQLTDKVESYKICEWAYNSYCCYNAIHIKDKTNYALGMSKEELIEKVRGTSTDYNVPLTDTQLNKKPIEWLQNAYNNIKATHNLINIMEVKGKDLEIVDTDKYEYIMTYSFPCQDLSLAGKGQGMSVSQKEGGTRSGLLWEVERILTELYEDKMNLPQILLMENVPEVIGSKNVNDFVKWETRLKEFGYSNYFQILNAKDYGIPQNRRRVFMISILGDYSYTFPHKIKLHNRLKDLLEEEVDEKYYLSDKAISFFTKNSEEQQEKGNGFKFEPTDGNCVSKCITTRAGGRMDDNFISEHLKDTLSKDLPIDGSFIDTYNKKIYKNDIAGTITTRVSASNETYIAIKNKTKKGYLEATNGDGVDISSRMETHRGTVQKGLSQTLTCAGGANVGVVVDEKHKP